MKKNELRWIFAVGLLVLFGDLSAAFAPAPVNKGVEYLENAIHKFDGVKDYTVDVKIHTDIKAVQAPDMEATVYYKQPDKIKIDPKGLFLMPKNVGMINPREFDPDKYLIEILDTLTYDGDPAVRLSLVPKKNETSGHNVILTIDKKEWLIREIATAPYPGREASAKITYAQFDGFQMPVKIEVTLNVGKVDGQGKEFGPEHRRLSEMNGKVEIYYSNYKINSGLSDKIFEKRGED